MRLHYYRDPRGNFGDDLNAWLWPQLLPDLLDEDGSSLLVGIGTLLNRDVPSGPTKAVFGSGVGYAELPVLDDSWHFYCVRGPMTAAALGLPPEAAVTDSALLVRQLVAPAARRAGTVFVPHHDSLLRASLEGVDLAAVCAEVGITYLDPAEPVPGVLEALRGSELVVAEAMHAAIVADALRVPWVAARLYEHVDERKWQDWTSSLDIRHEPVRRGSPVSQTVATMLTWALRQPPQLSADSTSDRALAELQDRLDALRRDVASGRLLGGSAAPPAGVPRGQDDGWNDRVLATAARLHRHVPPGEPVVLVDGGEWPVSGILLGRRVHPFHERDGVDQGPPADDMAALDDLARHLASGARHVAVTWGGFWWLEHYAALAQHLVEHADVLVRDEDLVVLRVRQAPVPSPARRQGRTARSRSGVHRFEVTDGNRELLQVLRATHALTETSWRLQVAVDELPRWEHLRRHFDVEYDVSGGSGDSARVTLGIDHAAPETRVGPLVRPLLFPNAVVERLRAAWQDDRGLRYSFCGLVTPARAEVLDEWRRRNLPPTSSDLALVSPSGRGRTWPGKAWDNEYFETLARSQFVLCPNGDHVWTYRFFEAALCGALPVVEGISPLYEGFRYHRLTDDAGPLRWNRADAEQNFALARSLLTAPRAELEAAMEAAVDA